MTGSGKAQWLAEPFVMGTPVQFAALREFLEGIGFTEAEIVRRSEIGRIFELPGPGHREKVFVDSSDPLSVAVRLFMDSASIPWSEVRAQWPASALALMESLGIVRGSPTDPDCCLATIALYPNERLYIASERHHDIAAFATGIPSDIVYSTLTAETRRFLELMPRRRCTDYLELCSGAAIAALVASRDFAERAWAVDITERSTRFARFNAAINGATRFTALQGDLYEPVRGQTFDLIAAHPPYMPAFETEMVFRDAGDDGEDVTRRILDGLADHLRPGGQFYCDCMMSDRTDAPLEERIRGMLGPKNGEFDILLAQAGTLDPVAYYADRVVAGVISPDAFLRREQLFKTLKVKEFIQAAFLIQRRRDDHPTVTRRRILSAATTADDYQWYLNWAISTVGWDETPEKFIDVPARRAPGTELHSRSAYRAGQWTALDTSLVTLSPFAAKAPCAPWFATMLAWCDGESTFRQVCERLRENGLVPAGATERDFATLARQLADGGFIELEPFPHPSAASR